MNSYEEFCCQLKLKVIDRKGEDEGMKASRRWREYTSETCHFLGLWEMNNVTWAVTAAKCICFALKSNFFIEMSSCNSLALLYSKLSRPRCWFLARTSIESYIEIKNE